MIQLSKDEYRQALEDSMTIDSYHPKNLLGKRYDFYTHIPFSDGVIYLKPQKGSVIFQYSRDKTDYLGGWHIKGNLREDSDNRQALYCVWYGKDPRTHRRILTLHRVYCL